MNRAMTMGMLTKSGDNFMTVTCPSHGFQRWDWVLKKEVWMGGLASNINTAEAEGLVVEVVNSDEFIMCTGGTVPYITSDGIAEGHYYLSTTEVGKMTSDNVEYVPGSVVKYLGHALPEAFIVAIQKGHVVEEVSTGPSPGNIPVGGEMTVRFVPPESWLTANNMLMYTGAELSRVEYAELWDLVKDSAVDEVTWQDNNWGCFSTGDGSTTFRIPRLYDEYDREYNPESGLPLGQWTTDTLKAHKHSYKNASASGSSKTYPRSNSGGGQYTSYTDNTGGTETKPRSVTRITVFRCK